MTRRTNGKKPAKVRCAIYTRKSTERGLDGDLTTLDVQRQACEAFIASQAAVGWTCQPARYDDGGFSGATTERPALQRLLSDIEAGHIDCVVTHRIDRLSRSMLDFLRIMERLERHEVTFVSVTQQFNTATAWGRMVQNILMGFAQFERDLISERTRDKMSAARRKGKWMGGVVVLGYDAVDAKLVVNGVEAERVRAIFDVYLEVGSLAETAREVRRRGWTKKVWLTKAGEKRGGGSFSKMNVRDTLVNPLYVGRVRHNGSVYEGEHDAIVGQKTWDAVQTRLRRNGTARPTCRSTAILRGLLFCAACNAPMQHHSTRHGPKVHRYYRCRSALENGSATCPTKTVPASEIEAFIINEIKAIGTDRELLTATTREARRQLRKQISNVRRELRIARLEAEQGDDGAAQRVASLEEEVAAAREQKIDQRDLAAALREFDQLWAVMTHAERSEVLAALIERIDFDGGAGTIDITYRPTGFEAVLARQGDGDR
jgi:site-specific DNA recombinase